MPRPNEFTPISEIVTEPEFAYVCYTTTTIYEALMGDPKIIAKLVEKAIKGLKGFELGDKDGESFESVYRLISVKSKDSNESNGEKDLGLYVINQIAAIVQRALPLQKGDFTLDPSTVKKFCNLAGEQALYENPVEDLERACLNESINQLRVDMFHEQDQSISTSELNHQVRIINEYMGELVKITYKPDIDRFINLLSKLRDCKIVCVNG